jgi:hypothetical protein
MAEAGKTRPRSAARRPTEPAEQATAWFCKNCGQTNALEAGECAYCGFGRDYNPDAPVAVDLSAVTATLARQSEQQREQMRFVLELVKNALLLILVAVFLVIGFRLLRNWPFVGEYERDANALLDRVLIVESYVELGATKAKYDEIVVPLMAESTKFELKYGESDKKLLPSYQKLVQSAEYYQIARDAWEQQLTGGDVQREASPQALSKDANSEVKNIWERALRNAKLAMAALR